MSRKRLLRGVAVTFLSAGCLIPSTVRGDEMRLVPSIAVKEEYNNNIFFSTAPRTSSFITTATPGLEFADRTERLDLGVKASASAMAYSKDSGLNSLNHDYRGWARYGVTPFLKVSADAAWRKETRADGFVEETGLAVTTKVARTNLGAGADVALGELTVMGLSYRYEEMDYRDQPQNDGTVHGASIGLVRDLGRTFTETKGRMNAGFTRSEFTDVKIDNYTFTVGLQRGLHELWSVSADAGARHTRTAIDVVRLVPIDNVTFAFEPATDKSDGWGWIASVGLTYKGETGGGTLSVGRDVSPAVGLGGAAERTSVVLDASRRFLWELSGTMSAGYYRNRSAAGEFSRQEIDEETWRVRPGLKYAFTRDLFAEGAYQYTRIRNRATGTDAEQSLVYLRVALQHRMLE